MATSSFFKKFVFKGEVAEKLMAALEDPNPPKIVLQPMKYSLEEQSKMGIELLKKHLEKKD